MVKFKEFIIKAMEFAFDIYTVLGGLMLLFLIYGFLWLIVSAIWKKVHEESYKAIINQLLTVIGKKPVNNEKEEK